VVLDDFSKFFQTQCHNKYNKILCLFKDTLGDFSELPTENVYHWKRYFLNNMTLGHFEPGMWNQSWSPNNFGWLESESKNFRWWSTGARTKNLSSQSTHIFCWASELYKYNNSF